MEPLTPDLLLHAYRHGLFPMADPDEEDRVYWYAPDPRAILPFEQFHVPRSLRRIVRGERFRVTTNLAFERVMRACAAPAPGRESTWISDEFIEAYGALHRLGRAHSVECWLDGAEGERLVGGLYGVALGAAFFGESMFHRVTDASKVALVHLVLRLRVGGFTLLDVQMTTPHLERFGVAEIPRDEYERRLAAALTRRGHWSALDQAMGRAGDTLVTS